MMLQIRGTMWMCAIGMLALAAGCGDSTENKDQPPEMLNVPRAHAEKGPHGGMLIELGSEEFHGELLHNETTGEVTIYLLDAKAENPIAIDAEQIAINVRRAAGGQQYFLKADAAEGDPQAASSRFVSQEKELGAALDDDTASSVLVLSIQGKQFRGEIVHDHAHGHAHP